MILANASIEIAASPAAVFDLFTTVDGLERWMARDVSVDLRPGGSWRWTHDNGDTSSGEYLEIEPPSRLAFTYGWESGALTDVPPGSTRVDVSFEPIETGTLVTIAHAGLPVAVVERHAAGWTYFLSVLRDVCTGEQAPDINLPNID